MFSTRYLFLALSVIYGSSQSLVMAQLGPIVPVESPDAPPPKTITRPAAASTTPAGALQFNAKLMDDSQIKLEVADPVITITTKYGKLVIPANEIKRLEIGVRIPTETATQLQQLVKDFSNETYAVREAAEKKILQFNELALPELRTASRHSDLEVSKRAKRIIDELQNRLSEEKFQRKFYDLIETLEFTATGKIELNELQIRSRIFGTTKLALTELRSMRWVNPTEPEDLVIDAGLYGKPNRSAWLDTGLDVTTDAALEIEASGQVELFPQQPGQMVCGPGGWPNNTMTIRNPNGTSYSVSNGALVGRIGNAGQVFVVGAKYKTPKPNEAGRLYLQVMPSPNGNDPQGQYKVKVKQGN